MEQLIENQEHQVRITSYEKLVSPSKIPVLLSGGVGDVIMDISVVESIADFGPVEVYTEHPEAFNYFNRGRLPNVLAQKTPVPNYTWFITVNAVVRFHLAQFDFSSSSCWFVKSLWERQRKLFAEDPKLQTLVKNHPFLDTALARYAREKGLNRRSFPFYSLGIESYLFTNPFFTRAKAEDEKYITIHDGYELMCEPLFRPGQRSNKQWDIHRWDKLVKLLHRQFPGYKIYQLGSKTARPIIGVDKDLINQTTLTGAFDIISKSSLHIDGDSGLVHAATYLGVPCVVLFGPTPDYFYGYKQNINLRAKSPESCGDACYWLKKDWLVNCPIGWDHPHCMDSIQPADVMEKILESSWLT